jgi:AraC family transcriptional regulator
VIDRSHARIPEHAHDWPVLSIFVLGRYSNKTERGEMLIAGPSAILYGAGAVHSNVIGPAGFEQIEIEFDPAWLDIEPVPKASVSHWLGGRAAAEGRALARFCTQDVEEKHLRSMMQRFIQRAEAHTPNIPSWIDEASQRFSEDPSLRIADLAREIGRHPSWLGSAYKSATGEGPAETAARVRLERATQLLRETDQSAVNIAMEAGFCDQSHMSRTFRRVLGRSPSEIRNERSGFRVSR